jgi:YesN/AraC family two-component response regulator
MYNELSVKIGPTEHKAFLQNGFFSQATKSTPLHKHTYAEIHIIAQGQAEYTIGDNIHSSRDGNLIIIPKNVFHAISKREDGTVCTAFQIDCSVPSFLSSQLPQYMAQDFIAQIQKSQQTGDYGAVSAYISLFYSFLQSEKLNICPIIDYSFLISEFFSRYYNQDLHLSDLADALHLSERQTERLVIKHTGNTFRSELSAIRIKVAKHLSKTTDMSLEEISRYVGYGSYAGFWKAMKRHETQK